MVKNMPPGAAIASTIILSQGGRFTLGAEVGVWGAGLTLGTGC